jgi:23S rRNA (guanine745-N1)-methyltransferase
MIGLRAPLACPVRNCYLPLEPLTRAWVCPRGHSFDVARSGYVNLLQPQDRRSPDAGDTAVALEARRRLLAAGIGRGVVNAFVEDAAAMVTGAANVVVDLGCGAGDALGLLQATRPVVGVGFDLSTVAVNVAARRFPDITWAVVNADRRLPLLDGSIALALSLHARRNPPECHRVLGTGGHLLVAVPAADDLIELRQAVQGARVERDRVADVIAEHGDGFEVAARFVARERHTLAGDDLRDVLRGTYRGTRSSHASRVEALESLEVTFASDFVLLRRR